MKRWDAKRSCGKFRFATEEAAQRALDAAVTAGRTERRIYRHWCGWWHLTSHETHESPWKGSRSS